MSRLYPVGLQLEGRRCLVVGGGAVAERKVQALLPTGAQIHVVAPTVTAALEALAEAGRLRWSARPASADDLDGCTLALLCANERAVNRAIAAAAQERGVLANVADAPEEGAAISPAVLERGDVLIAVWSGGGGPVVSQLVREHVAADVGDEWGRLSRLLARLRPELNRLLPPSRRAAFWRAAIDEPLLANLRNDDLAAAEARLRAAAARESE